MKAIEPFLSLAELPPAIDAPVDGIATNDVVGARELLCRLVPEYRPESEIIDYVHTAGYAAGIPRLLFGQAVVAIARRRNRICHLVDAIAATLTFAMNHVLVRSSRRLSLALHAGG